MSARFRFMVAASLLLLPAISAQAQHIVQYAPEVEADTFAVAPGSPGPGARSIIRNGVIQAAPADPDGQTSAGPIGAGATMAWAQAAESGVVNGQGIGISSFASADLTTGKLKARTTANSFANVFGGPRGISFAEARDTVFFNNQSGTSVLVPISYTVTGAITDPFGQMNPGGRATILLASGNSGGGLVRFSNGSAANDFARALFDFTQGLYGFQANPAFTLTGDRSAFTIAATLMVPTGLTSLGIGLDLYLDCAGGSSCDYGDTATFRFGALPGGLSFTSQSGVFLSNLGGAVPEPASWAMMIVGFGVAGGLARRRVARAKFA